jgi:putative ABC transport system permease protein
MTAVAERPVEAIAPAPRPRSTGGWRLATRLARREVRRRWGRTLLVMILVAVPVFGMTVVTTLVRTGQNTPTREFAQQFGAANLVAFGDASTPAGGWPAGTRIERGHTIDLMGLLAPDGTARLSRVIDIDLNNPVTKGAVLLREGRFPRAAGEALLSPNLARAFHVKVGDTLRLKEPGWTERVVGIGVPATNWNDALLAVRGNEIANGNVQLGVEPMQAITLVKLPGHPTSSQLAQYSPPYLSATTNTGSNNHAVDWTLVAGMIALAIAGVVISGAFAVGARRQLVTLGQLSANGADGSLLRRTLSLQGAWCGVLGTAVGIAGAVTTLTLMHARFDGWIHRDIGPYAWSARDLIAITITGIAAATIAAYFPARSASRVPVLSALAGRRPLGALPRTIVPTGLALFGGGVLVLVLVAVASRSANGGNGLALAAVFGGLLVLSGACCVSPVVVASLAALGRRLRSAGRVAARSLVRSRARSAAVVMALAAINAGAIALSTAFASRNEPKFVSATFMPNNAIIVTRSSNDPFSASTTFLPVPASVEQTLKTIVPDATWTELRAVEGLRLDNQREIGRIASGKRIQIVDTSVATVADPAILNIIGLSPADAATLQRVGALVLGTPDDGSGTPNTGIPVLRIGDGAATRSITAARAAHPVKATAATTILITPAKAQQLGLPIVNAGEIAVNPKPLDESQRASIDALSPSLTFASPDADPSAPTVQILWSGPSSSGISPNVVRQIILAIVVLIALLVLAMSLALSAAETRDERDVLLALGAPPRTMSGVAAWKAGLLAFTAAALAIPTGFIPVACVYLAAVQPGERAHLAFPWSTVGELLIIAPLIAAFVAAIGSSIAQRVRPTQMSTFATD